VGISAGKTHKEGDEDCGIHHDQTGNRSPAVADAVRDGTSEEDTNESTTLARLEERTLPFGLDGESGTIRAWNAVSVLEGRLRDKVSVQEHVEGLHDLVLLSANADMD